MWSDQIRSDQGHSELTDQQLNFIHCLVCDSFLIIKFVLASLSPIINFHQSNFHHQNIVTTNIITCYLLELSVILWPYYLLKLTR